MRCQECNERVTVGVISSQQEMKTKKGYGDTVKKVGQRVNVRLGLVCDCSYWRKHSFTYKGLDNGQFEVRPDDFPTHWIENYHEAE